MTFPQLSKRVREALGQQQRYEHCVRVARLADNLARRHHADTGKARLAGMLHDLARLYDVPRLRSESERCGIQVDEFARAHPMVLHAPLSAVLARERFGVDDPEILSAIAKHTLAAGEMTVLDCILYLADSVEPGRRFAERAELEALAFSDLRAAVRATIASSVRYLTANHCPVAPQTAAAMRAFGIDPMEDGTAAAS
jgi:predicted HD superfamily hydrolase involved in NAD metabolism